MGILLLVSVFLPLVGAAVCLVDRRRARQTALVSTLATFVLAAILISQCRAGEVALNIPRATAAPDDGAAFIDVRFRLALDGLSLWLAGLTSLLMVVAVLVGWEAIGERAWGYYSLLLLLETGLLGVFSAWDVILFYVFFEWTLVPAFFLIGIWGGRQRRYAARKFLLFALAGGALTLLGLLAVVAWDYRQTGRMTFCVSELAADLAAHPMNPDLQLWIFVALSAGFAVRVPLFALHTWLPPAHVEAPTAASVILAGVLLNVGAYGFLRFSLPMLPEASAICMPWLLGLSAVGIVCGALSALAQADLKRLIAYLSISYLGLAMLGIFAANRSGMQGGVLQLINHGLFIGGWFAVVGMLQERYHRSRHAPCAVTGGRHRARACYTQEISDFGGLARKMPILACFMLLLVLSGIGTPGLNGFASELRILAGVFQRAFGDGPARWVIALRAISVLAVAGTALVAWCLLRLLGRVCFGPRQWRIGVGAWGKAKPRPSTPQQTPTGASLRSAASRPSDSSVSEQAAAARSRCDLSAREILALVPLAILILWIGVYPGFFVHRMNPTLEEITDRAARTQSGSVAGL